MFIANEAIRQHSDVFGIDLRWLECAAPASACVRCHRPSPSASLLSFVSARQLRDFTPDTRWPLILYLHGGSLRGDDVEQLRIRGLPHKLESEPDFPFVVVSPQCPAGEIWTDAEAIDALLDRVMRDYRIDPQRIYITGHSMGGRGALYFAYRLPSRFAAVLALGPYSPITAWGDKLAQIPLWLFHGTADALAPIAETKELVQAIEAAGGHPRFNSLRGRDHFILDVYDRRDITSGCCSRSETLVLTQPPPKT